MPIEGTILGLIPEIWLPPCLPSGSMAAAPNPKLSPWEASVGNAMSMPDSLGNSGLGF